MGQENSQVMLHVESLIELVRDALGKILLHVESFIDFL